MIYMKNENVFEMEIWIANGISKQSWPRW